MFINNMHTYSKIRHILLYTYKISFRFLLEWIFIFICNRELKKFSDRRPSFVLSFQAMAEYARNLDFSLRLSCSLGSLELSVRFQSAKNEISLRKENKDNGNNKINKRTRRVGRGFSLQKENLFFFCFIVIACTVQVFSLDFFHVHITF